MRDAADYDCAVIRNYFKMVLQDEKDKLSWSVTTAMQELRMLYLHRLSHDSIKTSKSPGSKAAISFCLPFQLGKCSYTTDHTTSRGPVKHVCTFCLKIMGNGYPHAKFECRHKQNRSKMNQDVPADTKT